MRKILFVFVTLSLFITIGQTAAFASDTADWLGAAIECPFTTIQDSITLDEFSEWWTKGTSPFENDLSLSFDNSLLSLLANRYGTPFDRVRPIVSKKVSTGFSDSCSIIPFTALQPDKKMIRVAGSAFWDKGFSPAEDALFFQVDPAQVNYSPERMTSILMTGTTALARVTAWKMFTKGARYPGRKIIHEFRNADIRHISNEVSFWSLCPEPNQYSTTMQFCSRPEYFDLIRYVDASVIEMTGNHLRDYDYPPLYETFALIEEKGIPYYGAGRTHQEAAKEVYFTHNGNKLAFLGCNSAGPELVYVNDQLPGVYRCDFDEMERRIKDLRAKGWLPIVTLQYYEVYSRYPSDIQYRDFARMHDAGALVVSGSQAHYAQTMRLYDDSFVHYGLGNLFFDQMDKPVVGTRQECLDRLVIYDGRLLQVEIVTAMLEDYAQPRPMTDTERSEFLTELFAHVEE